MERDDDMYEDMMINCTDCGQSFTWTAGEQQFYSDRALSVPRRCKACRAARRKARDYLGHDFRPAEVSQ